MNWGYIVVVSGCILYTLFYGILFNYNLLNIEFKNTFNASATSTALPGSIAITTSGVSASLATFTFQAIGHRKTIGLGTLLCTVGLFLTSFLQRIEMVCISYGLMFGLGCAFMHLPHVDVTSTYFKGRYLTRVLCFQFVGVSVGLSLAPGVEWLYSTYTWRVALRIMAILLAVIGLPCTLVVVGNRNKENDSEDTKDSKEHIANESSQASRLPRYLVLMRTFGYVISMPAFLMMALAVAFSYISLGIYLEILHLEKSFISLILSIMGGADIVGRLLISFGSVHVPLSTTMQYVVVLIMTASFTVAIPFTTSTTMITVELAGLGMTRGVLFAAIVSAAIDVTPPTLSAEGIALMYLFYGAGVFMTPYITDSIYDITGSYQIGILICCGMYIAAAALFTIGHVYKTRYANGNNVRNILVEEQFERVPIDEKEE